MEAIAIIIAIVGLCLILSFLAFEFNKYFASKYMRRLEKWERLKLAAEKAKQEIEKIAAKKDQERKERIQKYFDTNIEE